MRIIGGRWRGKRIAAPLGRETRPTADRVREALFSVVFSLFGELEGAGVLDLFAGSGALGIEALSRGAAHCTFVESDKRAAAIIRANLSSVGAQRGEADIRQIRAERAAEVLAGGAPVSLLLADPPYRIDPVGFRQVLEALVAAGVLADGALVVYEHRTGTEPSWPAAFSGRTEKRYGDTSVSFAVFEG